MKYTAMPNSDGSWSILNPQTNEVVNQFYTKEAAEAYCDACEHCFKEMQYQRSSIDFALNTFEC